jgi:UDP-N-acetyl-D-glucosamine dehydrogenase
VCQRRLLRIEPDISFVIRTAEMIAPYLSKGALVVLESTTYPGTTDTDLRAVLEQGSGMKSRRGFSHRFLTRTGKSG